jgi:YVTN family beta-propeller protein
VADWYEHKLFVVDPVAGAITERVEVGQSPSGVAVTGDGKLILTADRDSNAISIVDARSLQRIAQVPVGERPFGITVDAGGVRAYTANVKSDDVSVVDLASRAVIGTVHVGRRPYAVALAGGRAFVTDQYGGTVTVFDTETLKVLKAIPVGDYPEGIEADPGGLAVFVACWEANTLERIDAKTLEVTARVTVGNGPRAFGRFLR